MYSKCCGEAVVALQDGHTYERAAITAWLAHHNTSPYTNEPLASKTLHPNHLARQMISNFFGP